MRFTYDFLNDNFNRFNREIFEDCLPPVLFLSSCARSFLGRYEFCRNPFTGKTEAGSRIMRFSLKFDAEPQVLEDVLLHEMIHLYIESQNLKDTRVHGKIFTAMMNDINARFHRHITLRVKNGGEAQEVQKSEFLAYRVTFCLMKRADGSQLLLRTAHQDMFRFWELVPKRFEAVSYSWYCTRYTFFARFKKSQHGDTAYEVQPEMLQPYMQYAKLLRREGNFIRS